MIKKLLLQLTLLLALVPAMRAQEIVTSEPYPLQEDAQNVVIYYHADLGNKELAGLPPTTAIYAHTGVDVLDADGNKTEWKNAPDWNTDQDKYMLEYVSENLWKLSIGDIHEFYGIPADEIVTRLCFVFRTSKGTKVGRAEDGGDIFLDVLEAGFQLDLTRSYIHALIPKDKKVTFTAATTEPANIDIALNGSSIASAKGVETLKAEYTFSEYGDFEITATAVSESGKTVTRTMELCVARDSKPSDDFTIPPLGLTRNDDGTTTFCFAAPEKSRVLLIGSWNGYVPLNENVMDYVDVKDGDYDLRFFKINIPTATTGKSFYYYFNVDGSTNVTDPYARLVCDPSNDKYISPEVYPDMPAYPDGKIPSGMIIAYHDDDLLAYNWKVTDFKGAPKDDLVVYELLFRDFTGTEGAAKGNGTVRGAMEKIPYLKELGINAVELLPINEFNGNLSWGYNPNFYFAIDKAYGTPQDYKEFIDACHAEGIAVILDVVFNQSDGNHPWYKMYKSGSNPFYNKTAPHAYSVLNDWRQEYPLVQTQWHDMLRFWLSEYNVDGFRFDLVKGLGDNSSYDGSGSIDTRTNRFNQSRVDRMKVLHDVMREVNPDAYFINELLGDAKEENDMAKDSELNWANLNNAGCQFAMGYKSSSNLNGMNAVKMSRTAGSTVAYLESHDEERMAYKQEMWGVEGVKGNVAVSCQRLGGAAAQMILVPGAHMIWQFSELGNAQTTKSADGGNNTSNKIVNWSLLDEPNHRALFDNYAQLISTRLSNPELFAIDNKDYNNNCSAWEKGRTIVATTADKELYCAINPNVTGSIDIEIPFRQNSNDAYKLVTKSYGSNPTMDAAGKKVTVPANCFVVYGSTNLSAVDEIAGDVEEVIIYALPGAVKVLNAPAGAEVYTLDGLRAAEVADASDATISLPAGLYIVRAAGRTAKLIVR